MEKEPSYRYDEEMSGSLEKPVATIPSTEGKEDNEPEDLLQSLSLESNTELTDLDQKVVRYLELLDDYIKLSETYRDNFKNGYINLSRANYVSNKRFNRDFYDHREVEPVINVNYIEGEFETINNLEIEKLELKLREKELSKGSDQNEKCEYNENKEGSLKNRKNKSETKKVEADATKSVPAKPQYRNPINMFGAFVPYQLRESQNDFNHALANCISLINMRTELQSVYKEIKTAKKKLSKEN